MADAGRQTALVATGIFVTRLLGFVRERAIAHFVGNGVAVDAFRAALRIPNTLRNLLGEGTMSSSFIPVYAGMVERGDRAGARALAGAVAGALLLTVGVLTLVGVAAAPAITRVVAPGFDGPVREMTTTMVRLLFPMTGILVLAAWCLGILTTHRRFFLPYVAPALWNIAAITTLVVAGLTLVRPDDFLVPLGIGLVAGSLAQLLVQLPSCLRVLHGLPLRLSRHVDGFGQVVRNWIPILIGAGAAQISALIDTQLGSLVGPGSVSSLGYAQLFLMLPISLFGVSVAAVALPEMSRDAAGDEAGGDLIALRLQEGVRRIAFFVIPTAALYVTFGPVVAGALFETGEFTALDSQIVGGVIAAYGIGVWAHANMKLLASGYYAMMDTKTPVKVAFVSLPVSAVLAITLMQVFGIAGIAVASSIAACLHVALLLAGLHRRVGNILGPVAGAIARSGISAAAAVAASSAAFTFVAGWSPVAQAALVVPVFGVTYVAVALLIGHPDAKLLMRVRTAKG